MEELGAGSFIHSPAAVDAGRRHSRSFTSDVFISMEHFASSAKKQWLMDKFFSSVQKKSEAGAKDATSDTATESKEKKTLPKGVVLGKDGKPYNSFHLSSLVPGLMHADAVPAPPSQPGPK